MHYNVSVNIGTMRMPHLCLSSATASSLSLNPTSGRLTRSRSRITLCSYMNSLMVLWIPFSPVARV